MEMAGGLRRHDGRKPALSLFAVAYKNNRRGFIAVFLTPLESDPSKHGGWEAIAQQGMIRYVDDVTCHKAVSLEFFTLASEVDI